MNASDNYVQLNNKYNRKLIACKIRRVRRTKCKL